MKMNRSPCNFASQELKNIALNELEKAVLLITKGNYSEFCRKFKISRHSLYNYLNQQQDIKPCIARELEQYTNGKISAIRLLGLGNG